MNSGMRENLRQSTHALGGLEMTKCPRATANRQSRFA